uniref:Putative serine/arginine repetitive matrix protein 1-like isoform X3 n=1 Tax=Davidia involucrata TaxID=16924 RepID=A0A5B7AVD6_DAVIN
MSGGFFRGTSADQDTRFSNKQAKLLKSQKFAPELEHLVDMTKVKMDVMRPWIANRVTEFLGFEDEVLINFIYGLLDGKEVNGKEVQISLTGFMEKNTGKFMKELWTLLLSAQKNASGVPQQLLDAKEEETRKKKEETDRIANEIQKKREKEGRDLEQEKLRKMDGELDISRANNAGLEPISKNQPRASSAHPADEKETNERNGSRGRGRVSRSPRSADRSPSSPRSISKSFSNSRSYSDERHKSRSISGSPQPRGRSISSERVHHSPLRRSVTPRRRHSPRPSLSPSRRRSSHSRRRSTSRSRHRSPSPVRRRLRSPLQRRSRSPVRRRSRSPVRRRSRSPVRRRSRSPMRHWSRSPMRRRSPSPVWRRSPPMRYRSPPVRRRSPPVRRRSPSPPRRRYRRSPSTPRRRFPSPIRRRSPIPVRRRSSTPSQNRSPTSQEWSSPSPIRRMSPSLIRRKSPRRQRSPVQSPRERIRAQEKFSPVRHAPLRENIEHPVETRKGPDSVARRPPVSLRSPQRDPRDRNDSRKKMPALSPSPYKSPSLSESPPGARKRSPSEDRRSFSSHESPVKQIRGEMVRGGSPSPPQKSREHKPRHDSPETSEEEEKTNYAREHQDQKPKSSEKKSTRSSTADERKDSLEKVHHKDEYSPERLASLRSSEVRSRPDSLDLRKKDQEMKSEKTSGRVLHPEIPDQQQSPATYKADAKNRCRSNDVKGSDRLHKSETLSKSTRKVDQIDRSGSLDSGSEESDKHRAEVNEKRKHKRSERQEVASNDDFSCDSQREERKEAKRRRKEEKRLRKEERRRRREERRHRREERRAEKLKVKSIDTATSPPEFEKNHDGYASDGDYIAKRESHASDTEETESEQKKLEIELRKKALESLRAKKGVGH